MANTLLSEQDLVDRGIPVAEQYRLRSEGKLQAEPGGPPYVYKAAAVAKLLQSGDEEDDEDEDKKPPTDNYPRDFDAAVSKLTRRGVPRQRAIHAVAVRQPELYARYLETFGRKPRSSFTAAQRQQLLSGWRAAVLAEAHGGKVGPGTIARAGRKHPGLYEAISGKLS